MSQITITKKYYDTSIVIELDNPTHEVFNLAIERAKKAIDELGMHNPSKKAEPAAPAAVKPVTVSKTHKKTKE